MILVIGGGPAGRTAAVHLASAGREVTLVEGGGLGGQCLHHGCMVVCALNDIARSLHTCREMHRQGITDSVPSPDLATLWVRMREVQDKIEQVLLEETRSSGVTVVRGERARINGRSITLGQETIIPESLIIATGSRPRIPDIPGTALQGVYNAHTLNTLRHVPETVAILGCGVMAAEWAYIFREFGSEVHLLCRSEFLKDLDPHLRVQAGRELEGVVIHEGLEMREIRRGKHGIAAFFSQNGNKGVIGADALLVAAGLVPASENITGIEKGPGGEIQTNNHMMTSVEGVYACGDVTGPPCLTPVARRQGLIAAAHILGEAAPEIPVVIPHAIHLKNEIASAVFPVESAAQTGSYAMPGPAGPGTFWWVPSGLTGVAKISFNNQTGAVTGVHAGGPCASSIVQYMAFLIENGIYIRDLARMLEVHPSTDGFYGIARFAAERLNED